MKKIIFIVFSFISLSLWSQIPVGSWRTHLAYSSVKQVAETPEKVYGLSDGALFSYDKTDQSVDIYSKLTGLSDTKISLISYSPMNKALVIVYENSNIDVLTDENEVYNIPDIKDKSTTLDKAVHGINFSGSNAYLATGYGLSVVSLTKYEIVDSYINKKTYSSAVLNGNLYTATVDGVYQGSLSSNLNDFNNWTLATALKVTSLLVFQNQLIALESGSGLYTIANNLIEQIYATNELKGMLLANNALLAYGSNLLSIFKGFSSKTTFTNIIGINGLSSINSDESVWIASGDSLKRYDKIGDKFDDAKLGIKPDGPIANSPYFMRFASDNKLLVVGGGAWDDRFNTPGHLMKFENEKWSHARIDSISIDGGVRDFVDVIEDPSEKGHVFVASWGEGLYEFRNEKFVKIHNYTNSSLEYIPSLGPHFHRISALCYDANGNLFMSNYLSSTKFKVRKKDGTWLSLTYPNDQLARNINSMICTKKGVLWALNVRSFSRVIVFDPKSTLENQNDDQSKIYTAFDYYDNSELKTIAPSNYFCIAEDKNGAIWMGTSEGPIVFNSPSKVFNDDFTCSRIKVPRNDGTDLADYLLDGVAIKAIAVDGGNRKWLGTENNGVYLVSDNGLETIHHFTADNSPLLSDKILSIAIHPTTGEVFIGTDKGLVSYRSDAIDGKKTYSDVYAFPNPVRPEYEGVITITGLKYKSTVRITDITGNSLFEGISEGGQITWNGRNRSGERVATGVYLVYAATSDGLDGIVTKILVVK